MHRSVYARYRGGMSLKGPVSKIFPLQPPCEAASNRFFQVDQETLRATIKHNVSRS